jgi:hypothetical protein
MPSEEKKKFGPPHSRFSLSSFLTAGIVINVISLRINRPVISKLYVPLIACRSVQMNKSRALLRFPEIPGNSELPIGNDFAAPLRKGNARARAADSGARR